MSSTVAGVLNVDKPSGLTSHDVVDRVRRLAGTRRVGHAGTLDPLATGVLVLCLGRATRLIEYVVGQDKAYTATVRLGQTTDTYDADGRVVAEAPVDGITAELIAAALPALRGHIAQVPPMFSAVKQAGRPLYHLARQGVEVDRPSRAVTVYALEMESWRPPLLTLAVRCSSGTYVRALAHDLGQALGCGGHVTTLRRTAVGGFQAAAAVPLAALVEETWRSHLQPAAAAVAHLPALTVSPEEGERLRHGQQVPRRPGQPVAPLVRVLVQEAGFLGVAVAADEAWQPRKMLL